MNTIIQSTTFSKWLFKLKDIKAKVNIARRIERLRVGNFGDHKAINKDIGELRITTGPGYRIYYAKQDKQIVVLLVGGDKSTQNDDIKKANEILKEYKNE